MRRLKNIVSVFGILLFILSAASVYTAMRGLSEIRPAESYEDQGVRTFAPYDVLPVQVKKEVLPRTGLHWREADKGHKAICLPRASGPHR